MARKAKRRANDDSTTGSNHDLAGAAASTANKTKKKRSKSPTVAPSGESSSTPQPSDDVMDTSQSGTGDNDAVQRKETVTSLTKKVREQQETINKLTNEVNFLLSYLGISKNQLPASKATAKPPTGSQASTSSQPQTSASVPSTSSGSTVPGSYATVSAKQPVPLSSALKQAVVLAVYRDFEDRDRRARNIVISGLKSTVDNDTFNVIQLLETEFGNSFDVVKTRRLGRPTPGKIQPILATLDSDVKASYVTQNAKLLRQSSDHYIRVSVYINPDVTRAEAFAAYQNRCERRQRAANKTTTTGGASSGSASGGVNVAVASSIAAAVAAPVVSVAAVPTPAVASTPSTSSSTLTMTADGGGDGAVNTAAIVAAAASITDNITSVVPPPPAASFSTSSQQNTNSTQ